MRFGKRSCALGAASLAFNALIDASPVAVEERSIAVEERSLHKRDITDIYCGTFSTGTYEDLGRDVTALQKRGPNAGAAAKSCSRLYCLNTSAIYLCNDQDVAITIPLSDILTLVDPLLHLCNGNLPHGTSSAMSGQIFTTANGGYNVVVGFGDNNNDPSTPPSAYNKFGPNGSPSYTCGGGQPCGTTICDAGSLVVTNAVRQECQEYMSDSYCGAGSTLTYSNSTSITRGWSFGGFVGIDSGDLMKASLFAGFSFTYTESTTTGSVQGISYVCGEAGQGNIWTCGIEIMPWCILATGHCTSGSLGTVQFQVSSPQTGHDGNNVFGYQGCVCKSCSAWANKGAPQPVCEVDCDACPGQETAT